MTEKNIYRWFRPLGDQKWIRKDKGQAKIPDWSQDYSHLRIVGSRLATFWPYLHIFVLHFTLYVLQFTFYFLCFTFYTCYVLHFTLCKSERSAVVRLMDQLSSPLKPSNTKNDKKWWATQWIYRHLMAIDLNKRIK